MHAWFENVAGPQYASALMWTVAALVLLVILLVVARIVRNLTAGTFVAGGRNRRTRLAVMDAAAVDNQRRLVLVRRDDVEHLILIGGPTDVVIEQNIVAGVSVPRSNRAANPPAEVALAQKPAQPEVERPLPEATRQDEPVVTAPPPPVRRPAERLQQPPPPHRGEAAPAQSAPPERVERAPAPRPVPLSPLKVASPAVEAETEFQSIDAGRIAEPPVPPRAPPSTGSDIDRALAREIETSVGNPPRRTEPTVDNPQTLEEEMSRLLGELSRERK
jgi:hypothetical protein